LANSPTETRFFESFDGTRLAWREIGPKSGNARAVVLIHGYFSNAEVNWVKYGHAAKIAAAGFRVIMPDLRGHGDSTRPHDAAAYPPDVLMRDGFALVQHLGLTDYDLGGYSLGARTTVRMLAGGATPRRVVIAGMGLRGLVDTQGRGGYFRHVLTNLGSFERGSSEWLTEAFLKTTGGVSIAFKNVKRADVTWEREPDWYASSPFAKRPFCSACGTPLGFAFDEGSQNMDLTVGSFDDPARFRPTSHFGAESIHEAWLDTRDLPRYRTDQHKPLVDRWIATVGKLPD
jgi:pimeloyl-ACP methyl ester carboxylesterase